MKVLDHTSAGPFGRPFVSVENWATRIHREGRVQHANWTESGGSLTAQIPTWIDERRQIIDIGPGGMSSVSRAYNLEHDLIFGSGYENYVIHDLGDITEAALEAMGGG